LVDFAQARINRIADAIDGLAEQIKMTNNHVERLNREVGELRGEVGGLRGEVGGLRGEIGSLRSDMNTRFDRVDHQMRDIHGEVILQANQIIGAQQQATRAMMRLDDIEQRPDEPKP
jgi:outer membrane murein-binding lipoprotein Lpp